MRRANRLMVASADHTCSELASFFDGCEFGSVRHMVLHRLPELVARALKRARTARISTQDYK